MKKWIYAITFMLLIAIGGFYLKKSISKPQPSSNVLSESNILPSPSPSGLPQSIVLNIDNVDTRISWTLANPKDVELYSNLKEQKLSEEIKVSKSCKVLVSGGFYSQDQTHLGLFVSNFKEISKPIQNATLNGFLWIDEDNKATINVNSPNPTPRLGMQSGPLLMLGNKPLMLTINNDKPDRRIVAGITSDNQLIFLALYKEQSELEGPLLNKLPEIINMFKKQTGINMVDAINLDGGSASIFISNYDLLREFNIIGSYFCIK